MWRAAGVTHLVWLPGFLAAPTKQEDVLFTSFVVRYGLDRHRFGAAEVVTLPTASPPIDVPLRVLSLGDAAEGYADGLYPVQAMGTYEALPEHQARYVAPERPWPSDAAAWPALVAASDAIVLHDRYRPEPALQALLDESFTLGQRYRNRFAIYLRKNPPAAGVPRSLP
jgi:hypothetical protein